MTFDNRLEYFDQCVAGNKTQFDLLFSKTIFNTFDRGYDLYRDYINQKSSITDLTCQVSETEVILSVTSTKSLEEIISDNMPKKGITPQKTTNGVDIHMKLTE